MTTTSLLTFTPPASLDGLSFTNIVVNGSDVGNAVPFTATNPSLSGTSNGAFAGLNFSAFDSGLAGAGSSETLIFNFDISTTDPSKAISAISSLYVVDQFIGPGNHVNALEQVYDTMGNLIGSQTFMYGQSSAGSSSLDYAQQQVHVVITLVEAIDETGDASSAIDMSTIQATFAQVSTSELCSIGDIVFLDTIGSGLESSPGNGSGLSGVTVQLLDAAGSSVLATTTTDATGYYQFTNLFAGTYKVAFIPLDGYCFSPQGVGANASLNSSPNTVTGVTGPITLTAGEHNHYVEAGLVPSGSGATGTASLGNFVWLDSNANGVQDDSEAGMAGVIVTLLNDTGTQVLSVTTTDGAGHYAFNNLQASSYHVKFSAPSGYGFTHKGQGNNAAIDSSPDAVTGVSDLVVLTAGQHNITIDAGLCASSPKLGYGGLTPGFWAQHAAAWDGVRDTKYTNLVSSGVLSAPDVIYALPNHGKSDPCGSSGVLLGDVNGNGTTDRGENTLFVPLAAAVQLINSSATANDTRQILLRHALAAQLNVDNHDIAPGGAVAGAGLISEAVQWLKGQGPFIYQDRSSGKIDFVGSAGVVDTGTSGKVDYNTNNAAFTSAQLTSRSAAWNAKVALGLSPADFQVSGVDIKNALQAFNQNQLVTSKDGTLIGWNSNGTMTDIHDNSVGSMWAVLRHAGVVA